MTLSEPIFEFLQHFLSGDEDDGVKNVRDVGKAVSNPLASMSGFSYSVYILKYITQTYLRQCPQHQCPLENRED